MGDSLETLVEQNHIDGTYARDTLLGRGHLHLNSDSIPWILNHIDCFVSESQGNESVEVMFLNPCELDSLDDEVWEKVGRAIGNLQAFRLLIIRTPGYIADDEVVPIAHWEILARILSHARQRLTSLALSVKYCSAWRAEESWSFARAIREHPTITHFVQDYDVLETFPTKMRCIRHWRHYQLWNR
jgi:hypothetical protein